jgi:hypothetical protein
MKYQMTTGAISAIFLGVMLMQILSAQYSFACTSANATHDSYQQGYNHGVHDWNMFAQDLSHHFICPYNDTSAYCFGYDAALRFETSDQ